jgi:hypothetical protein
MRTFQRICDEVDLSDMPAKMRRAARAREDRVNHEYQRAARVVVAGGRHPWGGQTGAVLGEHAKSWMAAPRCIRQEPWNW